MPKAKPLSLYFPVGGVVRRHGLQRQSPYTTPDAMNVWPTDWTSGRERGGTRPGLTSANGPGGEAQGWCEATWLTATIPANGESVPAALHRGVAVATSTKCRLRAETILSGAFVTHISGGASTDFTSCAVFLNTLYYAAGGQDTKFKILGIAPTVAAGTIPEPPGDDAQTTRPTSGTLYSDLKFDSDGELRSPEVLKGTPPQNCGIVLTWQDRLALAGDTSNPNQLYMCASGDAYNWDYTVAARGAAWFSGGTNGQINEPITSLIDHGDDCMMIGCTDSLYSMRGNPSGGGYRVKLTKHIGPLMQSAWCKDEKNRTWFLSRRGLHMVPAGCGQPPESMSAEIIPGDLVGIDPAVSGTKVSLGYDMRWRMIHIYIRRGIGDYEYWAYDLQNGGFWPMDFGTTKLRLAVSYKPSLSTELSDLLAIKNLGGGFTFDRNSSESIESYVWYGPVPLGNPMERGGILSLSGVLAAPGQPVGATLGDGQVNYDVYVGDSALQAFNSLSVFGDSPPTWNINGWNYPKYVRRAGNSAYIKLSSVNGKPWSIEEVVIERVPAGRRRVTA